MKEQAVDCPLEMMVEATTPREEVVSKLLVVATKYLTFARYRHTPIRDARISIRCGLEDFLAAHYFVLTHRKTTLDKMVKKLLTGYQKEWTQIEREIQERRRYYEKAGEIFYLHRAADDVLRKWFPDKYSFRV